MQMHKILIFKVTMSPDSPQLRKGHPYRIIAIPECLTLYSLAYEIVDAFNFDLDHCFGFYDKPRPEDSNERYELFVDLEASGELEPYDDRTKEPEIREGVYGTLLNDIFVTPGRKMYFLFDYGDNWLFELEFLCIEPKMRFKKYPRVMERRGTAPKQYS